MIIDRFFTNDKSPTSGIDDVWRFIMSIGKEKVNNKNGFSLVEMLISIIVAALLMLTMGALSSIANSSFRKLNIEQAIYNDISYGFKLMQNRVRVSTAIGKVVKPVATSWRSDKFVVGNAEFGVYRNSRGGIDYRDFVFIPDQSVETTQELILSVPDPDDSDNNLLMTIQGCGCTRTGATSYTCTDATCSSTPTSATLVLTGEKDNIPFDLETTIAKRN